MHIAFQYKAQTHLARDGLHPDHVGVSTMANSIRSVMIKNCRPALTSASAQHTANAETANTPDTAAHTTAPQGTATVVTQTETHTVTTTRKRFQTPNTKFTGDVNTTHVQTDDITEAERPSQPPRQEQTPHARA